MKAYLTIALLSCLFNFLYASEQILGQTWDFAEKNAVDEIQDHILKNKNQIENKLKNVRSAAKEKTANYKPDELVKLQKTKSERVFYPDMNYVLEFDIKAADGRIVYPKGYRYKITDYVFMREKLIVLDPTDKEQTEWFIKSKYFNAIDTMLILTDGNWKDAQNKFKRNIYYLTKPLANRFKLQNVPCIVEQIGRDIKVTEIDTSKKVSNNPN